MHPSSPELELTLDCPDEAGAPCWLDFSSHYRFVVVEWKLALGFGVSLVDTESDPRTGLFEGPDEVLRDVHSTIDRILTLLGVEGRWLRRKVAGL